MASAVLPFATSAPFSCVFKTALFQRPWRKEERQASESRISEAMPPVSRLRLPSSRGSDTGVQTDRPSDFRFSEVLPGVSGYATARSSLISYRRNNEVKLEVYALTIVCRDDDEMNE